MRFFKGRSFQFSLSLFFISFLFFALFQPQSTSAQTLALVSQNGHNVTVSVNCHGSCTGIQLDWGDGSAVANVMNSGAYSHTFPADGTYCIQLWCSEEPCNDCSVGHCSSPSCLEVNIGPAPDTVNPRIQITRPTTAPTYVAPYPEVDLRGTASDNVGVARVTWRSSTGGSGTASGTTSWSIAGIMLNSGANIITVTATDTSGNRATDSITVTYQEEEDSGGGGGTSPGTQVTSFTVEVMPTELSQPLEQSNLINLTYQAHSSSMAAFTVTSDHGEVVDERGRVLYRVRSPLSLPLMRGMAIRPEMLLLPPNIIARIMQDERHEYFYQRIFTYNDLEQTTQVSLQFTPSFSIEPVPSMFTILPNQKNPLVITYQASAPGPFTFPIRSERGEVVTSDGRVLYRDNHPLSLSIVQGRGRGVETLTLPPGVISKALQANSNPVYYRRTFTYGGVEEITRATLMILPSSMGGFMLTRMELSFVLNDQVTGTPGRVTVPPNYKGLKARAVLSYNGGGLLRGQWKVDDQVIGFVTRQLVAGLGDMVLESPEVPGFPTYATGSHKVELEILEPKPLFAEPLIYYFVSLKKKEQTIRLLVPAAGSVVALDRDILFRWRTPVRLGRDSLRLQIFSPQPAAGFDSKSSTVDLDGHTWMSVLLRPDSDRYLLPLSYKKEVRPGETYHWQVSALKNNLVTGFSGRRAITFARGEAAGQVLFEDLALGKIDAEEGSVAANLKNATDRDRHNVRVEFLLDDEVVDVSFLAQLAAGDIVPVEGGYPVEDELEHRIVVRALEEGSVLAEADITTRQESAKAPPPLVATCEGEQLAIGEFCLAVDGGVPVSGTLSGSGTIHVDFMNQDISVSFSGLGLNAGRTAVEEGEITVESTSSPSLPWQDLLGSGMLRITTIVFEPDKATASASLVIEPPYMSSEIHMDSNAIGFHPQGLSGELSLAEPLAEQTLNYPLDKFGLVLNKTSTVTLTKNDITGSSFDGTLSLPTDVLPAELSFSGLALQDDGGLYGTVNLAKTTIAATNIGLAGAMIVDLTTSRSPSCQSDNGQPSGNTWMGAWLDNGTITLQSLLGGVDVDNICGLYIDSGLNGTVEKDLEIGGLEFGEGELLFTILLKHLTLSGNNHSSGNNTIAGSLKVGAKVPLAGEIFSTDLDITADGLGDSISLGKDKDVNLGERLPKFTVLGASTLGIAGETASVHLQTRFSSLGNLAHQLDGTIDAVLYIDSTGKVGLEKVSGNDLAIEEWLPLTGYSLNFTDLFLFSLEEFGFRVDEDGFAIGIHGGLMISDNFATAEAKAGIYLNSGTLWCEKISVGFDTESISFEGDVFFHDDDKKKEFRGNMDLSVIDTLNVEAELIVGRQKRPQDFYYFYIDGNLVLPPPGITLTPYPIAFYGFGGGFYYNMCPSLNGEGERTYGASQGAFGLKAGTSLGTSFDKGYTFHARPMMELSVQTNGGGSNSCNSEGAGFSISLSGPIYLLCDLYDEKDYRKFDTFTEFGCSQGAGCAFSSRISVDDFAVLEPGESQLLGIDADMDMKLGADEWYFRMGTRDAPSTVTILPNYADDMLSANGYLEVDDAGIRAGALVQLDSGEQTLLIFYGRIWGGLSSDFEVSFDPGFVYAEFAVWMGVEAGLDLDSLGKIEIFSAEARLDGGVRTPDPTRLWIHGKLEYSVLDGLASGNWEMTFVWGDPLPELEMTATTWPVLDSIEPGDGSMDVPVGSLIKVNLTTPVSSSAWGDNPENTSLGAGQCGSRIQQFPDSDGNVYELAALLDDFWLEEGRGGSPGRIPGTIRWNDSCSSFTFIPDSLLKPYHGYIVHFKARARGSKIQGFDYREDKTFYFQTAGMPADLKLLVEHSYPENGQKHCFLDYPVEVTFNRSLDFLRSGIVRAKLMSADGVEVAGRYSLSGDNRTVRFEPDSPLDPDTLYTFRLVQATDVAAGGMTPVGTTGGTLDMGATGMERETQIQGAINELVARQRQNMTATGNSGTASASGPTVVGDEPATEQGSTQNALPGTITDEFGVVFLKIRFRTGSFHTLAELLDDDGTHLSILPPDQMCSAGELAAMQGNPTFAVRLTTAEPLNWNQTDLVVHSTTQRAANGLCRMELGPQGISDGPPYGSSTYSHGSEDALQPDSSPDTGASGPSAGHTAPDTGTDTEGCHSRRAERNIYLRARPTLVRTVVGGQSSDDSRYGFSLAIHPDDYYVERLDGDCEGVNRLWDHEFETGVRNVSTRCLQALIGQLADAVRLDIQSTVQDSDRKSMTLDVPDIPDSWGICGEMTGDLPTYTQDGDAQDAEIFVHDSGGMYQAPQSGMDILGPGMFQDVEAQVLPGLNLDGKEQARFGQAVQDFGRLRQEYGSLSQGSALERRYAALADQYNDLRDQFLALGQADSVQVAADFSDLVDSFTELNAGFQSLNNGDDLF